MLFPTRYRWSSVAQNAILLLACSLIKVCYKVSLAAVFIAENSFAYLMPNDATMLAENVTVQPYISTQINSATSKSADLGVIQVIVP